MHIYIGLYAIVYTMYFFPPLISFSNVYLQFFTDFMQRGFEKNSAHLSKFTHPFNDMVIDKETFHYSTLLTGNKK
jgi:hypothetical protein